MNVSAVQIYQLAQRQYDLSNIVGMHMHNFFHLTYVEKGCADVVIEESSASIKRYVLTPGSLHLLPWGVSHQLLPREDKAFCTIEVKFIPTDLEFTEKLLQLPYVVQDIPPKIAAIIRDLNEEGQRKNPYYKEMVSCRFTEALIFLLRQTGSEKDEKRIDTEKFYRLYCFEPNDWIGKTTRYIKNNLNKGVSAKEIAAACGFSESYFNTLFKQSMGITLGQYRNNIRYFKAVDLMVNSNLNVTQVAEVLGFSSIHYFSRFVKKMSGYSPNEFMRNAKGEYMIIRTIGEERDVIT